MKNIFKDVSSSTLQVILNQILGLFIFLAISRNLEKGEYGELNWSLAILTFSTTILSFRLEQIVVRRVAAGENSSRILTLFSGHIILSGILFYLVLLLANLFSPAFFNSHNLLMILAVSQLLSFFSSPFKQLANGKEEFAILAVMSSLSNVIRAVWILWVILFSALTIQQVLVIYIASSFVELVVCIYLLSYKMDISLNIHWKIAEYQQLIKESMPQIGVVFLNAAIARFDWILLGLFSTSVITAEYSFAYKVYELSPIPMLILAPVLLSRFSKYFSSNSEVKLLERKEELSLLVRFQMIFATLLPLVLNILWVPLIDWLTNGKYGSTNELIFFILSLCVPFLYFINLLWTINFAQNRLGLIFKISSVTCLIIVVGDSFMIPLMQAKGAAIVYLLAIVTECILFFRISILLQIKDIWKPLVYCLLISLFSGALCYFLPFSVPFKLLTGLSVYGFLLILTNMVKRSDLLLIRHFLRNTSEFPTVQYV
jgi:O-antigen/teichoic acid export membrane protein